MMNVRIRWEDQAGWVLGFYHSGVALFLVVCTDENKIVDVEASLVTVIK